MEIEHGDHGLSQAHWDFVGEKGFFIRAYEMPESLAALPANLWGPSEGDAPISSGEVEFLARNGRDVLSRLVNRPARTGRFMIVIGMETAGQVQIFTAYGSVRGVIAPREVGDSSMAGDEPAIQESALFWADHALAK